MSMASIKAGMAHVELSLRNSKFVRGLNDASAQLNKFGSKAMGGGAKLFGGGLGALTGLGAAAKSFTSIGSEVKDMADRTGMGVVAVQELAHAARMSGTDMAGLEQGFGKFQQTLSDAAGGSEEAAKSLGSLGLRVSDLKGLSGEKQLALIADRMAAIGSPAKRTAVAMDLFGRSGRRLLPMLQGGSKGLAELRKAAQDKGIVFSEKDINDAEAFGDELETVWTQIKVGIARIGKAVMPVFRPLVEQFSKIATAASSWIEANSGVVVSFAGVAAAVAAAGAAVVGIGFGIRVLGGVLGSVGAIGRVFAGVFSVVTGALGLAKLALLALLSPMGLIVVGTAAAVGAVLHFSGVLGSMKTKASETFGEVKAIAGDTIGGIRDALSAGDIGLAAKILWQGLKTAFQAGVMPLKEMWTGWKEAFFATTTEAFYGIAKLFTAGGVKTAWINTCASLSKTWAKFTGGVKSVWATLQNELAKKWVEWMAMFDSTVDVKGAQAILDEEFNKAEKEREKATKKDIADTETARQKELDGLSASEKADVEALNKEKDREHVARKQQYDADLKASQDELEKNKADLKGMTTAAAAAAEAKRKKQEQEEKDRLKNEKDARDEDLQDQSKSVDDLTDKKKSAVIGTFSGRMAAQIAGAMRRAAPAGTSGAEERRRMSAINNRGRVAANLERVTAADEYAKTLKEMGFGGSGKTDRTGEDTAENTSKTVDRLGDAVSLLKKIEAKQALQFS